MTFSQSASSGASPAAGAHHEDAVQEFVTVHIGDQLFGVEVSQIQDVFSLSGLTPVPLAPAEIAGVLNLRGRIVTALDARARLGLEPRDPEHKGAMVIGIERRGEAYGLVVDSVGEVLRLSMDSFESNPNNLDPRWQEAAAGVYRLDGRLLIVLNIETVLAVSDRSERVA